MGIKINHQKSKPRKPLASLRKNTTRTHTFKKTESGRTQWRNSRNKKALTRCSIKRTKTFTRGVSGRCRGGWWVFRMIRVVIPREFIDDFEWKLEKKVKSTGISSLEISLILIKLINHSRLLNMNVKTLLLIIYLELRNTFFFLKKPDIVCFWFNKCCYNCSNFVVQGLAPFVTIFWL